MARNKRRTVKDKEKLKKIKEEAQKRWRQKKIRGESDEKASRGEEAQQR